MLVSWEESLKVLSVKSFLPATALTTVTLMECMTNSHSSGCVSERIIMEKNRVQGTRKKFLKLLQSKPTRFPIFPTKYISLTLSWGYCAIGSEQY